MEKNKSLFRVFLTVVLTLCLIVFIVPVTSVSAATKSLNYKKKTIEATKSFTLAVKNAAKTDKIKFSTDNKNIAKVTSKGKVTGVAPGTAKITVKLTDSNKKTSTYSCKVTVTSLYVPTISEMAVTQDGDFVLDSSPKVQVSFVVDKKTNATVRVYNSSDEVVYQKSMNVSKNKKNTLTWNGKTTKGKLVEEDNYYFEITSDTASVKSDYFYAYETSAFASGSGSESNPYEIANIEQFKKMVAHNKCSFYMSADLDLEYGTLNGLFSEDCPFNGTLDGKGHTISNIAMNPSSIFMAIGKDGVIKNLNVNSISKTDGHFAMFVQTNDGLIENCSILNAQSGSGFAAPLVYYNNGTVKKCHAEGMIGTTSRSIEESGLVMKNQASGKIMNSTSSVTIKTVGQGGWGHTIGGIASVNNGLIINCNTSGTYSTSRYSSCHMGTIAGYSDGVITNCYGTATGVPVVGAGTGVIN